MINLEEIMKEIEKGSKTEKTTKELKDSGLNDYYIKKAIENGYLEKISRGKYKVVGVEKNKNRNQAFQNFAGAVFSNDFESAYDNLLVNLKNQTTHDYDYHLKLYFILLKELLNTEKDFSFVDDIFALCDNSENSTYYQYFIEFTEAVLSSDFDKAYKAIGSFRKAEKERKGRNCLSTKLFTHLTYNIHKKNEKAKLQVSQTQKEETKKTTIEEREQSFLYKKNYAKLIRSIETENYEEALIDLQNTLKYARPVAQDNLKKMYDVLTKYLEIKSSKEILEEQEIDYTTYQDDYNKIFNKALELKDYQTAYGNIGKCVYLNQKSTTLQLYRNLLRTLIEQNNKNKNNIKIEVPKNVENEVPKNAEIEVPEELQESKPIESIPQVEEVDMKTLLDLIYDRKYEEVKELLKNQNNSDERVHYYILRMIQDIDEMNSTNKLGKEKIHFYKYDHYNTFKRFFEALNYKCYEEASNIVDDCINFAERNNNSDEFVIYKYMLEDILNLKEEITEKQEKTEKLKALSKSQKAVIYKKGMKEEDIENLENVTLEKLELFAGTDENYDKHILEMIETLRNITDYNLDNNSFETFSYTETDMIEKFLKAISLGDYKEAYQISREEKWLKEMKKSDNKAYLIIFKKLLYQINRGIENNSLPIEHTDTQESLEENPLLEQLSTLKLLVKKRKFITAYNYYQEHNLEGISEELDQVLQVFLPFIEKTVKKEACEIEDDYKKASNRGEYDEASKHLDTYQEFIEFNDLNRNIDYHKARIESGKIEIETADFTEKEQLYDAAKYYYHTKQFQKAIEVLDEYIRKDNDISAKGYLLRGRSYERIKKYSEAKSDYEKAISIIPEPNAYHRLGKINYYSGDYQTAVECFLEYEDRRPGLHDINLEALSNAYKVLGQEELSEKYKSLIKVDSKN